MNKGKLMLHRSKKTDTNSNKTPVEHICRRSLLVKSFAYLTFGGIVCYNLYKKIVRKAFAMRLDKFVSSQRPCSCLIGIITIEHIMGYFLGRF